MLVNDVYDIKKPGKDTVRILAVLKDTTETVVVISLLKVDTLPYFIALEIFEEDNAVINKGYPPAMYMNPTEKQIASMENNWKIIGDFVQDIPACYDPKVRSRFITSKSRETGLQRKQIQRLLYRYWANGMTKHAMIPAFERRGAPGELRKITKTPGRPPVYTEADQQLMIGDRELVQIQEAMEKYYTRHTKYTYRYAYQRMIQEHYTDPVTNELLNPHPTENQFRYHAKKFEDQRRRVGAKTYDKDMRGILGSSRQDAKGPGDMYQIDATIADVYLVAQDDRTAVVGRPVLYFVTDVFSRMITGFYTCLESASWDTARSALLNAFMDKAPFCAQYGVNIKSEEWPCSGLPRTLLVDNAELISKASNAIIANLGITISNASAWRPDLKGIVESRFRLLNIATKATMPGAVLPDHTQRGAADYRKEAKLTLREFTKIIIYFVLNHNRKLMAEHPQPFPDVLADRVPAIPLILWKWGIENRTGNMRQMQEEDLLVALSLRDKASVTAKGIKFHGLYFQCETALKENWFAKARSKGSWKIDIAYHPNDLTKLYWLRSAGYEPCDRTADSSELYHCDTLDELLWLQANLRKQKKDYSDISLQADVDYLREIDAIVKNAEQEAKTIPLAPKRMQARPEDIRKNRKKEAEKIRKEKEKEQESAEISPAAVELPVEEDIPTPDDFYARFSRRYHEEDE